eukprot:CAMPEP_0205807942 /NCGR_PEP_ID=MMETSP0205-20121125/11774_1 /ASSEMBLY_ACC=CAM_ASM_000278 /TAXON_ID=36767 /ORGANISM="Euplotes focardii, Strain TN1" /LENGTH=98 /DNA_ID=CAMNT_0053082881 /DNA_START=174 /DNA_END=470 /DNA_ORIENTATION=+
MCMFKDPGIIPRPVDYIKRKAKWEIEVKVKEEEMMKKRQAEVQKRFAEYDEDDTKIPMNETLENNDTKVDLELEEINKNEEKKNPVEVMTKTKKKDCN